jgi:polysaccharide pyruvyl transferase WcaK-like protein
MRLHALILAASYGVPAIAAAYDPKVTGFMAELGQADRRFELGQFAADRVCGMVDGILADRLGARAAMLGVWRLVGGDRWSLNWRFRG